METQVPAFTLITQNVDGLHQLAGSKNVIEIHGNIHRSKCSNEGTIFDRPELYEGKPCRASGYTAPAGAGERR
jgi:NAD-dependent deacetylase